MKQSFLKKTFIYGLMAFVVFQSCNDKKDNVVPPAPIGDQSFSQGFESIAAAQTAGWKFINLTDNAFQNWSVKATYHGISPFDGAGFLYGSYLASDDVEGNISLWAVSPKLVIQNGDKISFYAISNGADDGYPDRLQLRMNVFNTADSIGDVDAGSSDVGNFTTPLLDINQSYSLDPVTGFPDTWTKFTATVQGLNKPDSGRIALRYYMEMNGGANGDEIGVDKFTYTSVGH